jgi:Fe-S cluster assembly protein SufD
MTAVLEDKDIYLSSFADFEKELKEATRSPLYRLRAAAIERFAALGFPTTDNEEWRFTSVVPLTRVPFHLAGPRTVSLADCERVAPPTGTGGRLVFINGRYTPELSAAPQLPDGVLLGSLAAALKAHPDRVEPHLARHAEYEDQPFTALNTAFIQDGAFLFLPRGRILDEPVHLLFISTAPTKPTVTHPRCLIVADTGSQARIVESYVGLGEDVYFTNGVTEVVAGPNAVIDHYKVQRESRHAFHVHTLHLRQERSSTFSNHAVTLGGSLVRNDLNAVLGGEGCHCTLNGLYLAGGRQHVDNHTVIDHALPHCESHELYKGILDGQAHGVFNGKIFVRQDAQKTDAKQTNQTLLLSSDATINTKPQLEIFADDVKCTHGATVGQLDAEAVFYLRSRGLTLEAARSLLTFAFANDIIGRIQVDPLRTQLEEVLLAAQQLPRQAAEEAV